MHYSRKVLSNGMSDNSHKTRKTIQNAKHAKPYIMRKTNLFHMVTHCSCNFSSGVLIENPGNLYNVSLENLTHLLGNLGKLEETFTM